MSTSTSLSLLHPFFSPTTTTLRPSLHSTNLPLTTLSLPSFKLSNPKPYAPKPNQIPATPTTKTTTTTIITIRRSSELSNPKPYPPKPYQISATTTTSTTTTPTQPTTPLTLSSSTKTLTTLFALSLNLFLKLKSLLPAPPPQLLPHNILPKLGPLFIASIRDRPSGYLNTPLTVVAAGMAKWLDIYSGVLMVRVLLSWFPNIPWDRQPLSAIRDLCDPYLNLFRNIIPPIFDTLDVSPLLAFAVLGTLGSILNSAKGIY